MKKQFSKILIIRGIGFRAFVLKNELYKLSWNSVNTFNISHELPYRKYLIIRAGHTVELVQPVSKYINIKTNKKDRKLIIYGNHKKYINNFTKLLYCYRKPSIYTGRGIRQKYMKISYKAGKKDKQKGKSF